MSTLYTARTPPLRPASATAEVERPAADATPPRLASLVTWPTAITRLTATTLLVVIGGLAVWSILPVVFGWQAQLVVSGSMEPAIAAGDVVSVMPVDADEVRAGQVLLFTDPADPARTVLHRVVRRDDDGRFITRGDANRSEDTTPLDPSLVIGLPRLRIPFVGLPVVWHDQQDHVRLGVAAAILVVSVLSASGPRSEARPAVREPAPGPRLARITA